MEWAVQENEPTWLNRATYHCGAPQFLWDLCLDEMDLETMEALCAHPEFMDEELVRVWQRWRPPSSESEWRV